MGLFPIGETDNRPLAEMPYPSSMWGMYASNLRESLWLTLTIACCIWFLRDGPSPPAGEAKDQQASLFHCRPILREAADWGIIVSEDRAFLSLADEERHSVDDGLENGFAAAVH